ncbi:hypothetical protein LZ016_15385 [Sphingomonas sp. SM33]|uniref:Uncharacterized protein n=1 Tax=Sphingomonas telluris TaxID=2907998 RepID=A0ABS9VR93_9SPHN|nr:hypothetical protein [Sphingomonas telluris]MCH8617480.1 hypothetical protein [Sphingomonas telluris]
MTANRTNISTSADGTDIFTVGASDSPFTNLGKLSTAGAFSSPIHAGSNGVVVINKGDLLTTGEGSVGIIAYDSANFFVNNVTIKNYATIITQAFGDNLSFADGIDAYGNANKVTNYGTINVADPAASAIYSVGAGSTIVNYGALNGSGNGIYIDVDDGTETGNTVINYGSIHTTFDDDVTPMSHGIWVHSENNVIRNYGFIQADGYNGFGISMEAAGNHAENYGTILVTGEIARGVLLVGERDSFDNYGLVRATGEGGLGVRFSSQNPLGSDGGVFTNYGKVEGAARSVSGVDSDDHVVNRGALVGDVSLGAGSDSFVAGKNSSLDGILRMGDGDDLIVFEKGGGKLTIADFTAGASTDDVIDLSGLGCHSLADVLSHASQSGADVVLKFGAKDQIVLQDVTLASLAADDFSFASFTFDHAMAAISVLHVDYMFG